MGFAPSSLNVVSGCWKTRAPSPTDEPIERPRRSNSTFEVSGLLAILIATLVFAQAAHGSCWINVGVPRPPPIEYTLSDGSFIQILDGEPLELDGSLFLTPDYCHFGEYWISSLDLYAEDIYYTVPRSAVYVLGSWWPGPSGRLDLAWSNLQLSAEVSAGVESISNSLDRLLRTYIVSDPTAESDAQSAGVWPPSILSVPVKIVEVESFHERLSDTETRSFGYSSSEVASAHLLLVRVPEANGPLTSFVAVATLSLLRHLNDRRRSLGSRAA